MYPHDFKHRNHFPDDDVLYEDFITPCKQSSNENGSGLFTILS